MLNLCFKHNKVDFKMSIYLKDGIFGVIYGKTWYFFSLKVCYFFCFIVFQEVFLDHSALYSK